MVLESLFTPSEVEQNPLHMLILGLFVSSLGLWLAYYIFPAGSSSWSIFLTTLALAPLMHRLLMKEERDDIATKKTFIQRHADIIGDYAFMFAGMLIAFTAWFLLCSPTLQAVLFQNQLALMTSAVEPSTALITNLKILTAFILLAFVFGAGAVLLLTWDASITAVLIGSIISGAYVAGSLGVPGVLAYEIPKILGYSVGAIAGGILSAAIVRRHYKKKAFERILLDVSILLFIAVVLVVISAFAKALVLGI